MRGRTIAAAAAVALAAGPLLVAAPAEAAPPSTVWIENGRLRFYDTSNVTNRVQLTADSRAYTVRDTLGNLAAQYPCTAADAHTVLCPVTGVSVYYFDLRGGDDLLLNSTGLGGTAIGGTGADYLIGGTKGEVLYGNDGNDRLMGRPGNDRFYGGSGYDWVSYADRTAAQPVAIRMDNTVADDGQPGEKDVIWSDVENADGGKGADLIVGSNASNWLNGYDGADRIYGLGGNDRLMPGLGKDRVYGSTGIDYIDYANRTGGVRVSLGNGVADEGQASEGDYADPNVEGALGGTANDYLYGNNGVNYLYGNGGSDYLYGFGAGDLLSGGVGNDTVYGYDGNDNIHGGSGQDRLYGMNQNDSIWGDADNDLLSGGNGTDSGNGGTGSDTCSLVEVKTSCP
jgi:Ca2+-binding RTX toxin-like protein